MGFDLDTLRDAVTAHGPVARVVIAKTEGSSPREVGAAMLVWKDGQSGTIGGGTLEFQATSEARTALPGAPDRLSAHALGPDLGQCCGGRVHLLREVYDAARLTTLTGEVIARSPAGGPQPLAVTRLLAQARNQGTLPMPHLLHGWMIEPLHRPAHPLWIWGAGHVGRALAQTLAPLPQFDITWIDTAPDRFPPNIPVGVTSLPAAHPERLVPHAPQDAHHLILTYSHTLDLALCHALLGHGFASAGLIGSATKWARFRSRLAALGHAPGAITQITCPIGAPELGKHPQAIALGVATGLLRDMAANPAQRKEKSA
ncbi:xanthine dehydrogenase accessory protein XdhC [Thalassovita taeanensis]|uniref:Molybdenum cofactor sulfurylase n=1 Tax=Thalassovita taeanensis TaxID=657014 RepID=A0A1H9GGS1_9RHOB|nr:xanthine dehydrogenase accessory protein XdhC [Thalassovita taeanensis]SEQ49267.1 molybdenum cofactor sulfurylase [Thalassovita taeanensis]